jgi:putative membrane protein
MNNQQLIKSAHIWGLAVLLACGLWAFAGTELHGQQNQNQNQNSNSNGNANSNTSQNQNANMHANRNTEATGASAEQTGTGGLSSQDRDFLMDAAMGGMMEVQLGRWALQLGASDAVKQFAQRMVTDHSKANAELMTLASSKGITLPTELDKKHQEEVRKLTRLSGAEFDRAYAKMMLSDHNKDVSEFEKQSTKGADADVKAFATTALPTLKEHQQMAQALSPAPGGNTNSSNRNMSGNSNSNRNMNGNSNRP